MKKRSVAALRYGRKENADKFCRFSMTSVACDKIYGNLKEFIKSALLKRASVFLEFMMSIIS